MTARARDDKPRPSLKVSVEPGREADPERALPVVENIGSTGAEIFRSLVAHLGESGIKMKLVWAEFEVQVEAMVKDESIFKDDEEHRSVLIFRGGLQSE